MPSRRRLIIAGVLTLIVGLIVLFPARVVYQWIAPAGIATSGIRGSVWSGSAEQLSAGGIYLRELQWQLKPFSVLLASLAYEVSAKPGAGFIETDAAIGLGGAVSLSNLEATVPLTMLQKSVGIQGLQGTAKLQFERIKFDDGLPVTAIGSVNVADLFIPLLAKTPIGGYRAEFSTEDDIVHASLEDTDGVVDTDCSLQLHSDRSYKMTCLLAAKKNTPAALRQQLPYLGTANEHGQHEYRLEGRL